MSILSFGSFFDGSKLSNSVKRPDINKKQLKEAEVVTKANFKNHTLDLDANFFENIPDNREKAKLGDIAMCFWLGFDDDKWHVFKIEKLDDNGGDDFMGLGFIDGSTIYDLGDAYHVIVFK